MSEGIQNIEVGTETHDVLAPLTINFPSTTLDFTGATVSGLATGGVSIGLAAGLAIALG